MVVEESQRKKQDGEPGETIAGDGQSSQQAIELGQEDVQDKGETVVYGILDAMATREGIG